MTKAGFIRKTPQIKSRGTRRGYGYVCQKCGAHLDPGERCDCERCEGTNEKGMRPQYISTASAKG